MNFKPAPLAATMVLMVRCCKSSDELGEPSYEDPKYTGELSYTESFELNGQGHFEIPPKAQPTCEECNLHLDEATYLPLMLNPDCSLCTRKKECHDKSMKSDKAYREAIAYMNQKRKQEHDGDIHVPSGVKTRRKESHDHIEVILAKIKHEADNTEAQSMTPEQRCKWLRDCFKQEYCKTFETGATAIACCPPLECCYRFILYCEKCGKVCEQACPDDCCAPGHCDPPVDDNGEQCCFPETKKAHDTMWCPASMTFAQWCKTAQRDRCHDEFVDCLLETPPCLKSCFTNLCKGFGHGIWNFIKGSVTKPIICPYRTTEMCVEACKDKNVGFCGYFGNQCQKRADKEKGGKCCAEDDCERTCKCFWKELCGWCWCCCQVTTEAGDTIEGCAAMMELCQLLAICPSR